MEKQPCGPWWRTKIFAIGFFASSWCLVAQRSLKKELWGASRTNFVFLRRVHWFTQISSSCWPFKRDGFAGGCTRDAAPLCTENLSLFLAGIQRWKGSCG